MIQNPWPKALIAKFGSFAEVISATPERLKEVDGVGEAITTELKLIRAAALRLMKGEIINRPLLSSWSAILEYCRASMAFQDKEQFRILFLDKKTSSSPMKSSRRELLITRRSIPAR